ncbi:MAG: signal peptidase [Acidocella sp. 20-57-95]|nr:MAG: signal peptidase [Acidocella sp. 20-57-95]OYV61935.1 MAG: signal peptidase [Acidocella sp. 21-58-7]HQT63044.1 S49 family peptidase [Acidocella sp.]HQU03388.1 S49 family peptidase [Acidocella sp.]
MNIFFWRRTRIPVIALRGIIAARAGMINIDGYRDIIERGFALAKKSKFLVLAIESPGGSAVQSDLIGQLIRKLADQNDIKIAAVIGDVGASGGYWLACAADEIYANRLSIVGSIGVITGGFGLDKFIARYEIERRLFTAGENKARMEMFSPLRPQDEAFTKALLGQAHEMFKDWVRTRRGAKLTAPDEAVFDGGYMLGASAKERGLIDGFGDVQSVIKQFGGAKAKMVWLKPKAPRGLLRFLPRAAVAAVLDEVEARISAPGLR